MNRRAWHARAYRRSPRIPMPTAAQGYVTEVAEPTSAPTPALIARVDVAGNDDAGCPRYKTPRCHGGCGREEQPPRQRPMRSAAADGGSSTLPLVALVVAPLKDEADVAGNASAAPRHEQRRAARERAGIRRALRARRPENIA